MGLRRFEIVSMCLTTPVARKVIQAQAKCGMSTLHFFSQRISKRLNRFSSLPGRMGWCLNPATRPAPCWMGSKSLPRPAWVGCSSLGLETSLSSVSYPGVQPGISHI